MEKCFLQQFLAGWSYGQHHWTQDQLNRMCTLCCLWLGRAAKMQSIEHNWQPISFQCCFSQHVHYMNWQNKIGTWNTKQHYWKLKLLWAYTRTFAHTHAPKLPLTCTKPWETTTTFYTSPGLAFCSLQFEFLNSEKSAQSEKKKVHPMLRLVTI